MRLIVIKRIYQTAWSDLIDNSESKSREEAGRCYLFSEVTRPEHSISRSLSVFFFFNSVLATSRQKPFNILLFFFAQKRRFLKPPKISTEPTVTMFGGTFMSSRILFLSKYFHLFIYKLLNSIPKQSFVAYAQIPCRTASVSTLSVQINSDDQTGSTCSLSAKNYFNTEWTPIVDRTFSMKNISLEFCKLLLT